MSRTSAPGRQLAKRLFQSLSLNPQPSTATRTAPFSRAFSTSTQRSEDPKDARPSPGGRTPGSRPGQGPSRTAGGLGSSGSNRPSSMDSLANSIMFDTLGEAQNKPRIDSSSLEGGLEDLAPPEEHVTGEPYHFHVFSHKHNTHVTVTKPNRDAILSLSCGNLGFRKSGRKHYDSAYQLGAYVIDRLHQQGWHKKIEALEVVLRGFGPGREALTKVLLGNEGKMLRPKIVRVTDSTRTKFGGTRSKKPRRLG